MDFSGPDAADFAEVTALNQAFLARLRAPGAAGANLRRLLPANLHAVVAALRDLQVERLASSPFLLLSLRERDSAYWQQLAGKHASPDLFAAANENSDGITVAALSFLWHLARRNRYAVRLVSGADNDWCSVMSSNTLFTLLRRASRRPDLLRPRLAGNGAFWSKLLGPGLDSNPGVRRAAHTTCLQTLLTGRPAPMQQPRAAARRSQPPLYRSRPVRRPG
ncbi:MAG: hypothetical protein QNI96_09465 [Woeseiaceae bacterium]|nr:hypothetical protein [Woeseiaceae bacterium]